MEYIGHKREVGKRAHPHIRLFTKAFLTYLILLLVVTIPIWPIYSAAFFNAKESVIKEGYANLDKGCFSFEKEINTLIELATVYRSENNFKKISKTNGKLPANDVYTLVLANNIMKNYITSSNIVVDSYMMFCNNDMAISKSKIITNLEEFYRFNHNIPGMDFETWREYVFSIPSNVSFKPSTTVNVRPSNSNDFSHASYIYCVISLPIDRSIRRDSIMLSLLDSDRVLECLATEDIIEEGFLYIVDSFGEIIFAHNYDGPTLSVSDGISEHILDDEKVTIMSAVIGQDVYGLTVVAGLSDNVFAAKITNITRLILMFAITSVLLGLMLSLYMAYRQSRPISGIVDTLCGLVPDAGFPNGKRLDEYAFINSSILQIDQMNRVYKQEIDAMSEAIRSNVVQRVLNGYYCTASEKEELFTFYNLTAPEFTVAAIAMSGAVRDTSPEFMNLMFGETSRNHLDFRHVLYNPSAGRSVLLLNHEPGEEISRKIEEALRTVSDKIRMQIGALISVGISQPIRNPDSIPHGFSQAKEALRALEETGKAGLLRFQNTGDAGIGNIFEPAASQNLCDCIVWGDTDQIAGLFRMINDKVCKKRYYDLFDQRQIFFAIRNTIANAAQEVMADERVWMEIVSYEDGKPWEELLEQLRQSALLVAEYGRERRRCRKNKIEESIVEYLREHYDDPNICAASVAQEFDLSEKYLFSLVKRQTSASFGDFLLNIRLKHAEELLRDTDIPINLIHERVGYHSVNTFYKAFKRVYHMSPGAWRTYQREQSQDNRASMSQIQL